MKIEKEGVVKELSDEFMLGDYISAGWKIMKQEKPLKEEKPLKKIKFGKEEN